MTLRFASLRHILVIATAACAALVPAVHAQKTASLTQIVRQADPGLHWAIPADLSFGEPLTSAQLDATAAVPGTFTYQPAAGTVPQPGPTQLTVNFTPSNPNYAPATLSVPLNVLSGDGATFQLKAAGSFPGPHPFAVQQAMDFQVVPVGNFHQPVSLSCTTNLAAAYTCSLSQQEVRPTTAPMSVKLILTPIPGALKQQIFSHNNPTAPAIVAVGSVPLLALALVSPSLRRRKHLLQGLAFAAVLCTFAFGTTGCGSGVTTRQVVITGKSLTETKSITIPIDMGF